MNKEAVALCRVSTAQQRVDNNSLESQQKHVYDFAMTNLSCEIDRLWSLDVSSKAGGNLNRKDLMEIRQYCKEHRYIKYFIVDKVNRLMREIKMFYWFIQELEMIGVRTYFADPQQQDLNKDDPVAQLKTFLAIYEAERDNKERANTTLTRMKDRYLLGYRLSSPVPGYRKTLTPGLHEPDPARFNKLQSIMRDIVAGKFTVYKALEELNLQDYTTITGKRLKIDKFREILTDDYYAGFITIKKWDDPKFIGIKGQHQAMITPNEHEILKSIVTGKKRIFERRNDNKDFPLSNIGLCECGGKLVGANHSNGKGWIRPEYRCRSCNKQYRATNIHLSLDQVLEDIRISESQEEDIVKRLSKVWKEEESNNLSKIRTLEIRLAKLKDEKTQIARKIALNTDPTIEDDLQGVLKETKNQIDTLESGILDVKNVEKDLETFVHFSLKFINEKLSVWKLLEKAQRIKCKQLVFPGGFIVKSDEKVYTPEISPLYRFVSNKKEPVLTSDSHLVELVGIAPASKKSINNH